MEKVIVDRIIVMKWNVEMSPVLLLNLLVKMDVVFQASGNAIKKKIVSYLRNMKINCIYAHSNFLLKVPMEAMKEIFVLRKLAPISNLHVLERVTVFLSHGFAIL